MKKLAAFALVLTGFAGASQAESLQTAIFAGGCFWCVESDFDKVAGVVETTSGYTGGTVDNATYKQVGRGNTGHFEAVRITYDADIVSYDQLLHVFWRTIDPTDAGGQFCDRGSPYFTAVFTANAAETSAANASKATAGNRLGASIATQILPAAAFWEAESYHQDYYTKNPGRYSFYRTRCGRDDRVAELWGAEAIFANDH